MTPLQFEDCFRRTYRQQIATYSQQRAEQDIRDALRHWTDTPKETLVRALELDPGYASLVAAHKNTPPETLVKILHGDDTKATAIALKNKNTPIPAILAFLNTVPSDHYFWNIIRRRTDVDLLHLLTED